MTDEKLGVLGLSCYQLEEIDVRDSAWTSKSFIALMPALNSVLKFRFPFLKIEKDEVFPDFSRALPKLEEVWIEDQTAPALMALAPLLQRVTKFHLKHCPLTSKFVKFINQQLKEFSCKGYALTDASLKILASKLREAVKIHLSTNTSVKDFSVLAKDNQELREMTIDNYNHLEDRHVIDLAPGLKKTVKIEFSDNRNIKGSCFAALAQNCQELQAVIFRNCGLEEQYLVALAPALKNVVELDLSGNRSLTGAGLPALLANCQKMRVVCLKNCNLKDEYLIHAAPNLKNVVELDLSWNTYLTGSCFSAFVQHGLKLQTLYLHSCERLTDKTLELLMPVLRNVTTLTLPESITVEMRHRILLECPKLKYLSSGLTLLLDNPKKIMNFVREIKSQAINARGAHKRKREDEQQAP